MAVGDYFQWLRGTLRTAFKMGKADFDTSALTAARTITVQDLAGIMALETWQVSAQSSNFSTGSAKRTIFEVDVSGGNKVATLSAATTGTILAFKLTTAPGGNTLTFSASIDGDSSLALFMLNDIIVIYYNGSAWKIVGDGRQKHKILLTNTSAQSIANSTVVDVLFNTESNLDPAYMHSTSSNTELVTIRRTGLYVLGALVVFANNTTGVRQLGFITSGSDPDPACIFPNPASGEVQVFFTVPLYLAAGVTVKLFVWQASGGSLNINTAGGLNHLAYSVVEQ